MVPGRGYFEQVHHPRGLNPTNMQRKETLSKSPLNTQPALTDLVASYLTPPDIVFDRNHGDIRKIDENEWSLHIEITQSVCDRINKTHYGDPCVSASLKIDLQDLKETWPDHKVIAVLEVRVLKT